LKEGSLASSNSLLTTISDISSVNAYFNISEKEYYQLNQGHESNDIESIQLLLPDGTYYPYKGELHNAESEIDENTGNIAFKATFSNPDRILRHGASGKLLITKPLHKAKLVPQKAVFEIQDKNYIFLVGADNIVKMKNIEVSQRIADFYVVTSPINEQDRIVYEGIQTLREGEKINPKLITIQ
jgi:membrane fusion protein (multidrug efflux system)